MGNNQAFTIFEHTVIGAYNLGRLDKKLLRVLMGPYEGIDIDSGGKVGLTTKDGLEVEEVVLNVWGIKGVPKRPEMPGKRIPKGRVETWKPEWQEWHRKEDLYHDRIYEMFMDLTRILGWRK